MAAIIEVGDMGSLAGKGIASIYLLKSSDQTIKVIDPTFDLFLLSSVAPAAW